MNTELLTHNLDANDLAHIHTRTVDLLSDAEAILARMDACATEGYLLDDVHDLRSMTRMLHRTAEKNLDRLDAIADRHRHENPRTLINHRKDNNR